MAGRPLGRPVLRGRRPIARGGKAAAKKGTRYRERVKFCSRSLPGLAAAWLLGLSIVGGLGCGGAAVATQPSPTDATSAKPGEPRAHREARGTIDPRPFLRTPAPTKVRSWVMPRAGRLDLGDRPSAPENEAQEPVEVMLVEPGPTMARVAVELPEARFVLWVERRDLLGVMARDVSVRSRVAPTNQEIGLTLHQGAAVRILERTAERSRVRYSGAVELETWVPSDSLTWQVEPADPVAPMGGGKVMYTIPGMAIRAEPRWGGELLAALARIYFISELRAVNESWSEVRYSDNAVTVRGYASRRDPPVPTTARAASQPAPLLDTNEHLTKGTCLYARVRGELVGIAGDVAAATAATPSEGWWTATLVTAWGPLEFAARRTGGVWQGCQEEPAGGK